MTYYNGYWYPKCNDRMFVDEKVEVEFIEESEEFDEEKWNHIRERLNEIVERELENEQISESTDN